MTSMGGEDVREQQILLVLGLAEIKGKVRLEVAVLMEDLEERS